MDEIDGAINEPVKDNPRSGYTLYSFNRQPWIVKNKYDRLEPLNVGAFGAVWLVLSWQIPIAINNHKRSQHAKQEFLKSECAMISN